MSDNEAQPAPTHREMVGHIVERLRDDILGCRLAPGARLVELELAERFDASRSAN